MTSRRASGLETALSQSLTELRERDEELDAFTHTVAHDLSNPVHLTLEYADFEKLGGQVG